MGIYGNELMSEHVALDSDFRGAGGMVIIVPRCRLPQSSEWRCV